MKILKFTLACIFAATLPAAAQVFSEDFESYDPGASTNAAWWNDPIVCDDTSGFQSSQSGVIGDQTNADNGVLDLGNQTFDKWFLCFYMYIPSNREAYWNLQGVVPYTSGEWIVGNIFMNQDLANPGVGLIDNCVGAPVNFEFPHDEWFRVELVFDIISGLEKAYWSLYVDQIEVIAPGTPFTDADGTIPTSLGGVNFSALNPDHLFNIDEIEFQQTPCWVFDTPDFDRVKIDLSPNPVQDHLQVASEWVIESITIYNILGQAVYDGTVQSTSFRLDTSGWAKGTYILQATVDGRKQTIKFVK